MKSLILYRTNSSCFYVVKPWTHGKHSFRVRYASFCLCLIQSMFPTYFSFSNDESSLLTDKKPHKVTRYKVLMFIFSMENDLIKHSFSSIFSVNLVHCLIFDKSLCKEVFDC